MSHYKCAAFIVCLLVCTACGNGQSAKTNPTPALPARPLVKTPAPAAQDAAALPALADLPRSASSDTSIIGIQVVAAKYADGNGTVLVFNNRVDDGSGTLHDQHRPAYAVYEFDDVQQAPVGLHIAMSTNSHTKLWVGLANWNTGQWDFWPGAYLSPPTIQFDQGSNDPNAYRSPDGRVAAAVLVTDNVEPVSIYAVQLFSITETQGFDASSDRWDGIKLTWSAAADVDTYRVLRRPTSQPDAPWTTLGGEGNEYPRYTSNLLDDQVPGGEGETYMIQTGFIKPIDGQYVTFWSNGVTALGKRRDNQFDPGYGMIGAYAPATAHNHLGFFINQVSNDGAVQYVKSNTYPPAPAWQEQTPGGGGPLVTGLSNIPGWPRPFYACMIQTVDNPAMSIVYSTADGVFTRIGVANEDGTVGWSNPHQAREAGNFLVGICSLPQMLGVITWNEQAQALQLNNSHDELGQDWYNFGVDGWPWYDVGNRKPEGAIDVDNEPGAVWLCYREAGTNQAVAVYEIDSDWHDDSPNFLVGPGPQFRHMLRPDSIAPTTGIIYLTPDQRELRLVRKSVDDGWVESLKEVLATAPEGETLGDFYLYLPTLQTSSSYLLFTVGGKLYAQFSGSAKLAKWSLPTQIGTASAIHNPQVTVVGYGPQFTAGSYATWLADTPDGPRIMYYDLRSITFADPPT